VLQILLDPGPPEVHQGCQRWQLLADLILASMTDRQLMLGSQRFDGFSLRL
jgi:hypothetical protein